MNERIKKLFKPAIIIAAVTFAICYLIKKPQEFGDYTSYVGYAVTAVTILICIYEKWMWRIIPWNRPPILKEKYIGTIHYNFNGTAGEKPMRVQVKQSWLGIDIQTATDINSSVTITAEIVREYGQDVLYYTYMTNPSSATQRENPIQHGTCRMILNEDNARISGKYWTSSNTTGDIDWIAVNVNILDNARYATPQ